MIKQVNLEQLTRELVRAANPWIGLNETNQTILLINNDIEFTQVGWMNDKLRFMWWARRRWKATGPKVWNSHSEWHLHSKYWKRSNSVINDWLGCSSHSTKANRKKAVRRKAARRRTVRWKSRTLGWSLKTGLKQKKLVERIHFE